jgi:hypothetical protein
MVVDLGENLVVQTYKSGHFFKLRWTLLNSRFGVCIAGLVPASPFGVHEKGIPAQGRE